LEPRYGLTAKMMQSGKVVGYFVVDSNGKQMSLSAKKTFELVGAGLVANWEVVTDEDGEKHLYSDSTSLQELPNRVKDSTTIQSIDSVITSNNGKELLCTDENGRKVRYTEEKLWRSSRLGLVNGVVPKKFKGKRVLESKDNRLRDLIGNGESNE
jgi:hypothetical protein